MQFEVFESKSHHLPSLNITSANTKLNSNRASSHLVQHLPLFNLFGLKCLNVLHPIHVMIWGGGGRFYDYVYRTTVLQYGHFLYISIWHGCCMSPDVNKHR